jgi:GntR family transcriptional repressor for pyruvate dehydrogenase complex
MSATPRDSPGNGSLGTGDEVGQAIRGWMFSLDLKPGDRLGREEDLARQFGVSRPRLREALKGLASGHLIRTAKGPGGGIFVAATPEDGIGLSVTESVASMLLAENISVDELLETRMLLEVPLAGLAAIRATEADGARLQALVDALAASDMAPEDIGSLDTALHRALADIAGNRLSAAFTQWIGRVLQPTLYEQVDGAIVESMVLEQHRDIVDAVRRGDPRAAEAAMREHLVYVEDVLAAVRRRDER